MEEMERKKYTPQIVLVLVLEFTRTFSTLLRREKWNVRKSVSELEISWSYLFACVCRHHTVPASPACPGTWPELDLDLLCSLLALLALHVAPFSLIYPIASHPTSGISYPSVTVPDRTVQYISSKYKIKLRLVVVVFFHFLDSNKNKNHTHA